MKLNFYLKTILASCLLLLCFQELAKADNKGEKAAESTLVNFMAQIKADNLTEFNQSLHHVKQLDNEQAGETPLSLAAKLGRLEMVKSLVMAGASIDLAPLSTITPLMKAAYYGHLEVVDYLIAQGASLRIEHVGGYEAFDWALESGQLAVLKRLLKSLAKESAADEAFWVEYALAEKDLLSHGSLPSPQTQSLALIGSVLANDNSRLNVLLELGFNPDQHNQTGYAALPLAVRLNQQQQIDSLIAVGANINIGNNGADEASPINQAARAGNLSLLQKLVKAGAEVNKQNARGYSALHLAANLKASECVKYLLQQGGNPQLLAEDGFSAFDFAYQKGDLKTLTEFLLSELSAEHRVIAIESLQNKRMPNVRKISHHIGFIAASIIHGFDLDNYPSELLNPEIIETIINDHYLLNYAARFGNLVMLKYLIESGSNIDQRAKSGYQTSALMDAVRQQAYPEIVDYLLENKAMVRQGDKNGDPAINWATYYGHNQIVALLLKRGADPLQQNNEGYTALRTAKERGHQSIVDLIEQHLAQTKLVDELVTFDESELIANNNQKLSELKNLNHYLSDGTTLLFNAVQKRQYRWIEKLIAQGVEVNQTAAVGYLSSPLMQAAAINDVKSARLLIENGSELNLVDKMGDPALNWSAYLGTTDVAQLLLAHGASAKIRSIHGNALEIAMRQGYLELVDLFSTQFQKSPEPAIVRQLFTAVSSKDFVALKKLLTGKLASSIYDGFGNSILTFAANKKCLACVELLLQSGQKVSQVDRIGFSALMVAARNGDLSMSKLLLKHQADFDRQANRFGMKMTPLMLAAANNHSEIVELLTKAGAKLNAIDVMGNTALHWSIGNQQKSVANLLVSLGADMELKNQFGLSPKNLIENI